MRLLLINPVHYYKVVRELFRYMLRPKPLYRSKLPLLVIIAYLLPMSMMTFFIEFALLLSKALIVTFFDLKEFIPLVRSGFADSKEIYKIIPYSIFVVLLGPIFEELSCRLYIKFSPVNLAISFSILSLILSSFIVFRINYFNYTDFIVERLLISISVGLLI